MGSYWDKKHDGEKHVELPELDKFSHPVGEVANRHPGTGEIANQVKPEPAREEPTQPEPTPKQTAKTRAETDEAARADVASRKAEVAASRAEDRAEKKAEDAKDVRDALRLKEFAKSRKEK